MSSHRVLRVSEIACTVGPGRHRQQPRHIARHPTELHGGRGIEDRSYFVEPPEFGVDHCKGGIPTGERFVLLDTTRGELDHLVEPALLSSDGHELRAEGGERRPIVHRRAELERGVARRLGCGEVSRKELQERSGHVHSPTVVGKTRLFRDGFHLGEDRSCFVELRVLDGANQEHRQRLD